MIRNGCETGCKMFTGGEIKHHPDCQYYDESMSKLYDDLRNETLIKHTMNENEIHLKLSQIVIDNDNLDYIKATGEICGKLRDDLVKLFTIPTIMSKLPQYISIEGVEMKYDVDEDEYYRHAGCWSLKYKYIDGILVADLKKKQETVLIVVNYIGIVNLITVVQNELIVIMAVMYQLYTEYVANVLKGMVHNGLDMARCHH